MRRYDDRDDWARQVPQRRWEGPYRDYGWESGESGLPEFRDPSVHMTARDRREYEDWRRRNERRVEQSEEEMDYGHRPYGRRGRDEEEWRAEWRERDRYDRGDRRSERDPYRTYITGEGYYGEPYGDEYAPQGYYEDGTWGRGFDSEGYFRVDWNQTGPYTGMGPSGYQRSDERILDEVCKRLTRHGQVDASDIEEKVENGEVTLSGSVENRRQKRMAEDAAETVSGVYDVHNRLTIQPGQEQRFGNLGKRESGMPGGGQGRTDRVGGSGVYPASGPLPEGNADVEGMAGWGQGERGAAGYYDHGESEIHPESTENREEDQEG